ncbi:AraC family transcriptional regulator [Limibacillus halophilus]|uniref:AraC-like DNA-binding protein n=1 Tax=Limibacillus halophilus TaxID=1579333 RepID=A0A839SQL7_9PROT|nr:helix-turn-helix transcriptional regulator [Limibacillus halophilus]MBB3065187.1 AraC-like DNA-binding protein [Limibacillus halophilus]
MKRQAASITRPASESLPAPTLERPVIGMRIDYDRPEIVDWHEHRFGQLLYAARGVLQVETKRGLWLAPPQRAVWLPSGTTHRVTHSPGLAFRSLHVERGSPGLQDECCVLAVSGLLRELILAFLEREQNYDSGSGQSSLAVVLLNELRLAPTVDLHLSLPGEPRLKPIVDGLLDDPGDRRGLADWVRMTGASQRTLERLFKSETGQSFGEWRRQLRLQTAITLLSEGEAVTSVAFAVGYESPSAFIAMFGEAMGESPGQFAARHGGLPQTKTARN